MDVDDDNDMLARVASGETLELDAWPALQIDILARLDKIAHTAFAIPDLSPRQPRRPLGNGEPSASSPMADPSSQEADKENAPVRTDDETKDGGKKADEAAPELPKEATAAGDKTDTVMERGNENSTETPNEKATTQSNTQPETAARNALAEPSSSSSSCSSGSSVPKLPIQLATMLSDIKSHLRTFVHAPPHTLQRLADLVLRPRAHYRALATYLHAVDRVVQVTSGLNTYPLPPAIPDMSSMHINGVDGSKDPAASVTWRTPTAGAYSASSSNHAAVGSDEALGGALLTPIPWLTRRSPESVDAVSTSSGGGSTAGGSSGSGGGSGALIHSESTETIDGPNGVGSIETVSVSVNGVPSTGHARGVTQGELLRQEQRAGVVPVSQLSRNHQHQQQQLQQQQQQQQQQQHAMQHQSLQSQHEAGISRGDEHDDGDDADDEEGQHRQHRSAAHAEQGEGEEEEEEEDEEIPHARGPDEIGVGDTGPQTVTTSAMGEGGLEMQGINLAAAVGRPPEQEEHHMAQERKRTPEGEARENEEDAAAATAAVTQSSEALGTKREAEEVAAGEPVKKLKEE